MQLQTVHDLFIQELQDLYSAEQQIISAMPKMIEKTSDDSLRLAFTTHLDETKEQARRLEDLCEDMDIDPHEKECTGMKGLLNESEEIMNENEPSKALDLALIEAAQKVEHYEIAGYGTAANYAKQMNHTKEFEALQEILQEEKKTDEKLTDLAESLIDETPSGM